MLLLVPVVDFLRRDRGRARWWRHEHPLHSGSVGGCGASGSVLEDEALFRRDAKAPRGLEKGIREGLSARVVLGGDDRVEEVGDAERAQGFHHDASVSARGDGKRLLAGKTFRESDYGFDGSDLRAHFEEERFLAIDGVSDGHAEAVTLVEDLDDAGGGDAAEFVKHGLGKAVGMRAEGDLPRFVVGWHGVGEGAVAVENVGVERAGREDEWSGILRGHARSVARESGVAQAEARVGNRPFARGAAVVIGGACPQSRAPLPHMPDIKFYCPECQTKIGVDEAAAGMQIDCPTCASALVIPPNDTAPVNVLKSTKKADAALAAARAEIEEKEKELAVVLAESAALKADAKRIAEESGALKNSSDAAERERDSLQEKSAKADADAAALSEARSAMESLRAELARVSSEREILGKNVASLETASSAEAALRKDLEEARTQLAKTRGELELAAAAAAKWDSEVKASGTVAGELSKAKAEHAAAEKERDELKAQVAKLGEDAVAVKASEGAAAGEVSKAKAAQTAAEKERDELKVHVAKLGEDAAAVKASEGAAAVELSKAKAAQTSAEKERDELKVQVVKLGEDASAVKAGRELAETEMKALGDQLSSAKDSLEAANKKLVEVAGSFAKSERERVELQRRVDDPAAGKALATLEVEMKNLRAQMIDTKANLAVMRGERDTVRRQIGEREAELEKAAREVAAVKVELDRVRLASAEASGTREQEAALLAGAFEEAKSLGDQVAKGESELKALRAELDAMTVEAASAKALREELEGKLAAKEEDARADAAKLWGEAAAANERAAELQSALDETRAQAEASRKNYEMMRVERDETVSKTGGGEVRIRELMAEAERQKTTEHTLRLQLEAAEKAAADSEQKRTEQVAERDRALAETARLTASAAATAQQLKDLRVRNSSVSESASMVQDAAEKSAERLRAAEGEVVSLKAELDATRAGLERTKQHVNTMQTKREQMRSEIARMKAQLGLAPDAVT